MFIVPISSLPSIQERGQKDNQTTAEGNLGKPSFSNIMEEAMDALQKSQEAAAQDAYDLAMGDVSNLHSLMINSAMEATAVETAVQLTSRAVSAYKEIMQMQI